MSVPRTPIRLPNSLAAWGGETFATTLCNELLAQGEAGLPLQQGVAHGGYADGSDLHLSLLSAHADDMTIVARLSVFFTEIIINCGCGDDPVPTNAYCLMEVRIDRASALAEAIVVED